MLNMCAENELTAGLSSQTAALRQMLVTVFVTCDECIAVDYIVSLVPETDIFARAIFSGCHINVSAWALYVVPSRPTRLVVVSPDTYSLS